MTTNQNNIMTKLIGNRLLVKKVDNGKEPNKAGLFIPESVYKEEEGKLHYAISEVIQIGDEVTVVKPGDIIVHYKNTGIDYESYRIITDKEIFGIK